MAMTNRIPAFMLASLQALLLGSVTTLATAETAEGPDPTATKGFPGAVLAPSSMPPGQDAGGYGMGPGQGGGG
jgi:hypothetical protein